MKYILNYENHKLNIHSYLENMFKYAKYNFFATNSVRMVKQIANIAYPRRAA